MRFAALRVGKELLTQIYDYVRFGAVGAGLGRPVCAADSAGRWIATFGCAVVKIVL